MKVVHIASGDLWAGAEVQLYNLATALRAQAAFEVEVVLLNHGELEARLRRAGLTVHVFDERRLSAVQIGLRLWRYLRRSRPDVVHTHRRKENVLGAIAASLAGIPSLRSVHGRDEGGVPLWRVDKRLYRLLDWLCGRYLQQRAVAVSDQLRRELASLFPGDRLDVIENGIDVDRLLDDAAAPADLPGADGRLRIGFIGRLVPVKRVDLFLRVARLLRERNPDAVEFYVVGDGPQFDQCRQTVNALGLDHCVHLLGFRPNVAPLLARMDLLLITSDHEGLPMTLLEAMGLNVAVVASAVGGIPQALGEGVCGVLVREQQPEAYVDALQPLLADPAARARLVQRASARVQSRYSAARNAADYGDLYRRLARQASGSHRSASAAASAKSTGA